MKTACVVHSITCMWCVYAVRGYEGTRVRWYKGTRVLGECIHLDILAPEGLHVLA